MSKPLEVVTWIDAFFDTDQPAKSRKKYLVRTVGWVTQDKDWTHVRGEKTPDGYRAVTHIPNAVLVKRTPLREADDDA